MHLLAMVAADNDAELGGSDDIWSDPFEFVGGTVEGLLDPAEQVVYRVAIVAAHNHVEFIPLRRFLEELA